MSHIVIVGGGISGLTLAESIRTLLPAHRLTVLESSLHAGGNIVTQSAEGYRVEGGPNGFLDNKPGTIRLCERLGIRDRLIAASEGSRKNRYVWWKDRLRALPGSLGSFLRTDLLSVRGKVNLLAESYRKRPPGLRGDESVTEFARRRGGKEVAALFADMMVTGIHGGDPDRLSAASAFPRLTMMERDFGSVFRGMGKLARIRKAEAIAKGEPAPVNGRMWSFEGGLQTLTDALSERLRDNLRTSASVSTIRRTPSGYELAVGDETIAADRVILACPSWAAAKMTAAMDSELSIALDAISYNRIAVVAIGYRKEDVPGSFDGFGYIAPGKSKRDVLGVQWCSSIFPGRAPEGHVLWRALCGGVHRMEMLDWSDGELIEAVHREMSLAMGVRGRPTFSRVVRWPRAIPQYNVGHADRVARIEAAVGRFAGLHIAGNSYYGVALNDCTESAARLGEEIARISTPV